MRLALIFGCLATILGGISVAAHKENRAWRQESVGSSDIVRFGGSAQPVRYSYSADAGTGAAQSRAFVISARREAFLGQAMPHEVCQNQPPAAGSASGEQFSACMSRFTSRQIKR